MEKSNAQRKVKLQFDFWKMIVFLSVFLDDAEDDWIRLNLIYNLHRQKRIGINEPIATNTGKMADVSATSSYGSGTFGPLGLRFLEAFVSSGSETTSSSSSSRYGIGGSWGTSKIIRKEAN